ncbi:unnamed protein product, partial [Chrysoparadoxa australica]
RSQISARSLANRQGGKGGRGWLMSSDEDVGSSDGEHRAAFTTENDYEDGKWIGGEFYASGQKRGRTQTQEERLYGVW